MTFREKIAMDNPRAIDSGCGGGVCGCPHTYGYESKNDRPCKNYTYVHMNEFDCHKCWDREIPGTEPLTYEHTTEPIGKVAEITVGENGVTVKITPENEKENNMTTTKKTKVELLEELESVKNAKDELEKELKNLEKYKLYEDMAGDVHAIYMAYIHAGFSEAQAYDLLKTMMQAYTNQLKIDNNSIKTSSRCVR